MRSFFTVVLSILVIDSLLTALFLKKTNLWQNDQWQNKYHRIKSEIYHHDLMPNIEAIEVWGGKLKRKIITNSIGFRDFGKRNNDPQKYRNVKEENGKFFVVDTESKGFKETNLANKYNKVAYIKFNKKYELPLEIKIENKDLQDILNLAEMNEENVLKEYSDI